jgi:23S rRNA (pseudouridine1915-N3)-methyltransferase
VVPEARKTDPRALAAQLEREARLIEKKVESGGYLVALDGSGKEYSSNDLAQWLDSLINRGISTVTFLVGGYLGIPGRVVKATDLKLSLSKMTLPHELARVVLLEQIYRVATILKGFPYHR